MNSCIFLLSLLVVFVLEVHSQNPGGIPVSLPGQAPADTSYGQGTSQQMNSKGMFQFNFDDLMRFYFLNEFFFN